MRARGKARSKGKIVLEDRADRCRSMREIIEKVEILLSLLFAHYESEKSIRVLSSIEELTRIVEKLRRTFQEMCSD